MWSRASSCRSSILPRYSPRCPRSARTSARGPFWSATHRGEIPCCRRRSFSRTILRSPPRAPLIFLSAPKALNRSWWGLHREWDNTHRRRRSGPTSERLLEVQLHVVIVWPMVRQRDALDDERHFVLADALAVEHRARQIRLRDDADAVLVRVDDRNATHLMIRHHALDFAQVG